MALLALRCPFDAALTVSQAVFLRYAFDALSPGGNHTLAQVCAAFGIATLCLFVYNGTIWSIYAPFVVRIEGRLRVMLAEKIASFPFERVDSSPHGEWMTLFNTDVQMPFSQPLHLPHAVNAILRIFISGLALWLVAPAVFGWVMLFVVPHIAFSHFAVARAMPGLNRSVLGATAANTGDLDALVTCAAAAALYDATGFLMDRFERSSMELMKSKMRMRARAAVNEAVLPLFGMGGYLVLLLAGAGWIAGGRITFGDLTAAFQYRGGVLIGAMMLINSLASIGASVAPIKRLNNILGE
ncbi:MAG: ABC transporter transmembrane domain-containing protein [Oscillospiraceae bacterium]|nr:ABC transporter transmembrane domain-containing protein [Oscillospiraceae bacterium]